MKAQNSEMKNRIRNILTLRYDPSGSSILPRTEWTDFIEYNGISQIIQSLLEGTIRKAVERYKPRRIGMGVSGGVDSTTVLALTRKCFPDLEIKSYCVIIGNDDREAEDARHASNIYSTDHKEVYIDNPFSDLEKLVKIIDEPRWNLYPYYLFEHASKECDLLLTGDGGDELFGGYVFRYKQILGSENKPFAQSYLETHQRDWVPDQDKMFAFDFDWNDIYSIISPYFDNSLPLLGKIFFADYNGKLLYDFAPTNNTFSRYFKLPMFAPILEPEVLHIATHIPYSLKYDSRNNVGKIVLRNILLENFGYRPATKEKVGWGFDSAQVWEKEVREICKNMFDKPRFVEMGIINKEWLPKGLDKADKHDVRYINKMFGLLALELWLKEKKL